MHRQNTEALLFVSSTLLFLFNSLNDYKWLQSKIPANLLAFMSTSSPSTTSVGSKTGEDIEGQAEKEQRHAC